MSLVKWAIFGLLMLPAAEIIVFVLVAYQIGFLATLALTILTSLAGLSIMRSAGSGAIGRARGAFGDGIVTRVELDGPGVLTVIGGFLLFLPGFLTDIAGALLLFAPTRRWLHATLRRGVERAGQQPGRKPERPGVVDLEADEWRRVPDEQIGHRPFTDRPG